MQCEQESTAKNVIFVAGIVDEWFGLHHHENPTTRNYQLFQWVNYQLTVAGLAAIEAGL
jgi:hypothetical protein